MMQAPEFLFFGYGSEYSLHPLARYMTSKGDSCTEIDMLHCTNLVEQLLSFKDKNVVFVTSAHPLYDSRNFFYYKTERMIISALHIMSTLRPAVSVYYPHDYKDPIKGEEVVYLSLFDLVLWPFAEMDNDIATSVRVEPVGWIKSNTTLESVSPASNPSKAVFFIGAFQFYLNAGAERFYADFHELFEAGVALKLPVWHDTEPFEAYLSARGVHVYPSTTNSIEVMQAHSVIVTHALSSVGYEACDLGKGVIYIKNPLFDYADPIDAFKDRGEIAFAESPAEAAGLIATELPVNDVTMRSFDFHAARNAIWGEYKAKLDL